MKITLTVLLLLNFLVAFLMISLFQNQDEPILGSSIRCLHGVMNLETKLHEAYASKDNTPLEWELSFARAYAVALEFGSNPPPSALNQQLEEGMMSELAKLLSGQFHQESLEAYMSQKWSDQREEDVDEFSLPQPPDSE